MFKPGELIICIDVTNNSFKGRKPKNKTVKWLTKGRIYTIIELNNRYNTSISIINDIGIKKLYSPYRFRKFDRKDKINKLIKIIKDKLNG